MNAPERAPRRVTVAMSPSTSHAATVAPAAAATSRRALARHAGDGAGCRVRRGERGRVGGAGQPLPEHGGRAPAVARPTASAAAHADDADGDDRARPSESAGERAAGRA